MTDDEKYVLATRAAAHAFNRFYAATVAFIVLVALNPYFNDKEMALSLVMYLVVVIYGAWHWVKALYLMHTHRVNMLSLYQHYMGHEPKRF